MTRISWYLCGLFAVAALLLTLISVAPVMQRAFAAATVLLAAAAAVFAALAVWFSGRPRDRQELEKQTVGYRLYLAFAILATLLVLVAVVG